MKRYLDELRGWHRFFFLGELGAIVLLILVPTTDAGYIFQGPSNPVSLGDYLGSHAPTATLAFFDLVLTIICFAVALKLYRRERSRPVS